HGFLRLLHGHALHLEQDAAGLDHRHPVVGGALALAHAGFGRLLGHRLVGEHAHPDLAPALDEAGHGHARGFDLAVGDPAGLEHLEAEVAEGELAAGPGLAGHASAVLLAELDFFGHKHGDQFSVTGGPWHGLGAAALGKDFALVGPGLDADDAVGGAGLGEAVINVGAHGVQRQAPLQVPLGAGDLGPVEAAGDAHLDALAAEAHRRVHRLAHGAAEGDPLFELEGDALGHQLGVELGLVDLLDVNMDFARGLLLDLGLELLDLGPLAADDDARARCVDDDADLVAGAGDLERADAGGAQAALERVAQLDVLEQQLGVALGGEPLGFPRLDEAEAEAVGMDFLTHYFDSFFLAGAFFLAAAGFFWAAGLLAAGAFFLGAAAFFLASGARFLGAAAAGAAGGAATVRVKAAAPGRSPTWSSIWAVRRWMR